MKKLSNFINLFLILFLFFFSVDDVIAEVKLRNIEVGDPYYYHNTKDGNYGKYYGTSAGSNTKYTRYKSINGNPAYCVQSETYAPQNGATYSEVFWGDTVEGKTWTESYALITGALMEIIDKNYSNEEEYVNTYAVLNSYLGLNKSINFSAYNSTFAGYIAEAKEEYNKNIKATDKLPSFSATASNSVMTINTSGSNTYYTGSFTLNNLISSYGGDDVTYKIKLPSGVSLYSDSKLKNSASLEFTGVNGEKKFYVKASEVSAGDELKITINASNESTYYIGRLWEPVGSASQILITLGANTYDRARSASVTFDVPDVVNKTIKLVKKDAATGNYLRGASLKLQLSGRSSDSCTIGNGNYSCSIKINEELLDDISYSVVESVAPDGYILGESISNIKWDTSFTTNVCYAVGVDDMTETDLDDCSRNYVFDTVCTTDDGVIKTGACEKIVDPSLPEDTPEEQKTYITVGTEEKTCYYVNGESVEKVDGTKCNTQYMKVTNNKGNLVVEYYNSKNSVEISKYAISGDKELIGAELKICSTKPDDKGNCTVVRNTLDGKCRSTESTEDGYLGLTNEFNCQNNDNGTKTLDMHWISGSSSKIWYGLPKGTYYLVETVAPSGFLPLTSSIEFTIDENGTITSEAYDETTKKLIVRNQPTNFKVIKQDLDTNKDLEGATLSICTAYKDENGIYKLDVGTDGYCVPAVLANGKAATWVTDGKFKTISGLGIGTYYLVELIAPTDYSIADAILFTVNEDGTISDKDGNLFVNNEIIMKDARIVNEKTGELPISKIILFTIIIVSICGLSYYYLFKKNGFEIIKNKLKKNK